VRILLIQPGPSFSTQDVFNGLDYGLQAHGLMVMPYRLDQRITVAAKWLKAMWRVKHKRTKDLPKPTTADILYQASCDALNIALKFRVDAVVLVSATFFHPDVLVCMKRAGLKIYALFTESPYDEDKELTVAGMVDDGVPVIDGCWTTERLSVPRFKAVNANVRYLRHAWHPERHSASLPVREDVPSHDVVFVGSGFSERINFLNAIDWTGIDLGLYGTWKDLGLKKELRPYIQEGNVSNDYAAALYRKAKIGLNLYRHAFAAESLNPRAYELAACGAFSLSEYRAEVPERFGELVPTFRTAPEAEALIRTWLEKPTDRAVASTALPMAVAKDSWVHRASTVLDDLLSMSGKQAVLLEQSA